jgi:hypothetical protein
MRYEEMGVRPSSVDSQHPACVPDVSLYRQSCQIPLYLIAAIFLPAATTEKIMLADVPDGRVE